MHSLYTVPIWCPITRLEPDQGRDAICFVKFRQRMQHDEQCSFFESSCQLGLRFQSFDGQETYAVSIRQLSGNIGFHIVLDAARCTVLPCVVMSISPAIVQTEKQTSTQARTWEAAVHKEESASKAKAVKGLLA